MKPVFKTVAFLPPVQMAYLAYNGQSQPGAGSVGRRGAKAPEKYFPVQRRGARVGYFQLMFPEAEHQHILRATVPYGIHNKIGKHHFCQYFITW